MEHCSDRDGHVWPLTRTLCSPPLCRFVLCLLSFHVFGVVYVECVELPLFAARWSGEHAWWRQLHRRTGGAFKSSSTSYRQAAAAAEKTD